MDYANGQLLTGSHDGTVRVWDCGTGQCVFTSEVGGEVDSMLVEHGWLFVGVKTREGRGEVRGWALGGGAGGEVRLEGHVGQVTSLAMGNGMLFSGGQVRMMSRRGGMDVCINACLDVCVTASLYRAWRTYGGNRNLTR